MVSDQARNHIGDTYWKESNELCEGDELRLDKGVLVEVAEAMGITQTDLAPVLAKKTKDTPKEHPARPTPSAAARPFQRPTSVAPTNAARAGSQLRHKSLNTLLGTPRGAVGKALPMKSPYEERIEKEKENDLAAQRAPKRQKTTQASTGWRASSPVQGDEVSPIKHPMPYTRTADARNSQANQIAIPPAAKVITISSEADHVPPPSSDVTLPATPAKVAKTTPTLPIAAAPQIQSSVLIEPSPVRTPIVPKTKVPLPKKKPVETPRRAAPPSSPPVSASNRLTNVDFAVQPVRKPQKEPSPPASPVRNPKAKSLRLTTGVKRATLLCQSAPKSSLRAISERRALVPRPSNTRSTHLQNKQPSPIALEIPEILGNTSEHEVPTPETLLAPKEKRRLAQTVPGATSKRTKKSAPSPPLQDDFFDDPEVFHGHMDQQLLVPSAEPLQRASPVQKASAPLRTAQDVAKNKSKVQERPESLTMQEKVVQPRSSASESAAKKARPVKKAIADAQSTRPLSPPPQPVLKPSRPLSRDISPAHTDVSETQARTTSMSPNKPLLSTGGFPRKQKRISTATTNPPPIAEIPLLAPETDIPPLPSHSLRTTKKGPLMSTTELASLLTKPKKRTGPADDPIEDATQITGKSPARKMRRVRSENDAPIPSTAEDWEKRNLPKEVSVLETKKKVSALAALVKRTDPRKKLQRAQSLNVSTDIEMEEQDLPSPVVDKDIGPWSTEAFDLFDWRPPGREGGLEGM
jgi:hypothetical protein